MKSKRDQLEEFHLHKGQVDARQFDVFDLGGYLRANAAHACTPHSHSYYQLIWFKSGGGTHYIDTGSFAIKPDMLFMVAKGQVHWFEPGLEHAGVLVHFNGSFILHNERDIELLLKYDLFNNADEPFLEVPATLRPLLQAYMDQIAEEVGNHGRFGNEAILSHVLCAMLVRIEREKRSSRSKAGDPETGSSTFTRFRALLEERFRSERGVAHYADELCLSRKTLNNIVKQETGRTVSHTIDDRVLLEAQRQLMHTGANVNEIGYDLGFEDPSYFVKFFKKLAGRTPSEFRRKALNN